jgi:hypothetical protein
LVSNNDAQTSAGQPPLVGFLPEALPSTPSGGAT